MGSLVVTINSPKANGISVVAVVKENLHVERLKLRSLTFWQN